MTDTSSSLPICVYCGTQRPADETRCPNCGKAWIDVSVDDPEVPLVPPATTSGAAVAGAVAAGSASPDTPSQASSSGTTPPPVPPPAADSLSADDTGEFGFDDWTLPPEPGGGKAKWFIPIVLVLAFGAMWVFVFMDRGSPSATTTLVASETTTSLAPTTTAADTTTTQAETTTTSSTTTTVPWPAAESWPAVGEAIPVTELGLGASGIGPIDLGTPIDAAAGAFVASLGTAGEAGYDMSMCEGTDWYWLTWGDLWGIFDGYDSDATFIAYRYESDGGAEPEPTLETLSGVRLGDTVETLTNTYAAYTVSFEVINGKDHFRLSDDGELLLWGPLSSTEPQGIVEGIYSPDPCPSRN